MSQPTCSRTRFGFLVRDLQGKITDAELIALAVAQASMGDALGPQVPRGMIGPPIAGLVSAPARPVPVQPAAAPAGAADRDSPARPSPSSIAAGHIAARRRHVDQPAPTTRAAPRKSHFAGEAAYGYSPSKSQFVWGMRLVLVSDPMGVPVGYDLVGPRRARSVSRWSDLACRPVRGAILFCRQGASGAREYSLRRSRSPTLSSSRPSATASASAPAPRSRRPRIRLVIESVFANLKCQMRLEAHLAKTIGRAGPANRSAAARAHARDAHATCSARSPGEARSSPMTDAEPTSAL